MFVYILLVRVLMAVCSHTWYVPDETWQSVEVAHHLVFGNGYLTWEWLAGIRSWLHPLVFAAPLALLKVLGQDSQAAVVLLPKLLQALITAVCEYVYIKSTNRRDQPWLTTLVIFSWHSLYANSRTLINTAEYCLSCLALSCYLKNQGETNLKYCAWVCVGVMLRPTSAILWAPLCLLTLVNSLRERRFVHMLKWLFLCGCVVILCILVDSYLYAKPTFAPLNFFIVNVYNNLGVNYGSHPWHWYFTNALPALLGPTYILFMTGLVVAPLHYSLPVILYTGLFSLLPHKEIRFLQSCLPFIFPVIAHQLSSYRTFYQRAMKAVFVLVNISIALYLSLVHQRGVVDAALYLGTSGPGLTTRGMNASILQLMPCHSTPLYSHIHTNMSVRFLDCTPNLDQSANYREEADEFYSKPDIWLSMNTQDSKPDMLLFFNSLQPKIKRYLEAYTPCATFFHTFHPEGRVGEEIVLVAKRHLATAACNNRRMAGFLPRFVHRSTETTN